MPNRQDPTTKNRPSGELAGQEEPPCPPHERSSAAAEPPGAKQAAPVEPSTEENRGSIEDCIPKIAAAKGHVGQASATEIATDERHLIKHGSTEFSPAPVYVIEARSGEAEPLEGSLLDARKNSFAGRLAPGRLRPVGRLGENRRHRLIRLARKLPLVGLRAQRPRLRRACEGRRACRLRMQDRHAVLFPRGRRRFRFSRSGPSSEAKRRRTRGRGRRLPPHPRTRRWTCAHPSGLSHASGPR